MTLDRMATSDWYNKIQTSVSNLTTEGLRRGLNRFNDKDKEVLSSLFTKKINQNKNLRPLVFYVGYCLAKGTSLIDIENLDQEEKDLIGDVTAAIESENIATYYYNHYLDQKGEIKDKQDEKNRVLAGILSNVLAQEIIENTNLENDLKLELIQLINQIDKDIAHAQIYEVNTGIFKNIDNFKDEEEFWEIYFDRCRKMSGQFLGRSAEMGYVVGARSTKETEEKRKIENFYTEMIALFQYANDLGDYAIPSMHSGTVEKNFYKDYGSDFKNGRLTYPNYLLIKRATEEDKKLIEDILNNGFTDINTKQFFKAMNRLSVFRDCFSLLNNRFKKERKKLWLPDSELRTLILCSIIIVKSNKLLSSIKKVILENY